ncbi:aggregation factor core [Leucothrix arctica]|uniref:Aggregation factor core n=1 Tax=Leucothrix arctica TaxID=1481894 RepID=A0A317CCV7_9GAMM|nr:aggregation factor core [Leucothrix arctica]PWQ96515.1 aggregation factor core [Leucothrix arctica]
MTNKLFSSACVLMLFLGQTAQANIEVSFIESAPKDRFVINNVGGCALDNLTLDIDLSKSAGRLIFDTTSSGAGVEVFQPFEVREGAIKVTSPEGVKDGDSKLSISIATLPSGKSVSFTIDVDDTLPRSALGNIRVAGSEIENGMVKVSSKDVKPTTALFSRASKATLVVPSCKTS